MVTVPIRMGGGTRLKVVEGLAMGKALVSTAVGCEGIAVRDNEQLLIRDGAQAFASGILTLFEDTGLAAALGRAGRGVIEREYSWDLAGERLESLYRQLMPGPGQTPSSDGARADCRLTRLARINVASRARGCREGAPTLATGAVVAGPTEEARRGPACAPAGEQLPPVPARCR